MSDVTITCRSCGSETVSTGVPVGYSCPTCGSPSGFDVAKTLTGAMRPRGSLRAVGRDGRGRKFIDLRQEAGWFAKDRRWHVVMQVVDRRNRRYRKKIVDEETGKILRDDDERLEDHIPTAQRRRRDRKRPDA